MRRFTERMFEGALSLERAADRAVHLGGASSELLQLQVEVFRAVQVVELGSRLVDRGARAVDQLLRTQI